MDREIQDKNNGAFVGVSFNDKVIYNLVENDVDFLNTGLSIIQHLKNDKNNFIGDMIKAQSYDTIKYIFDDEIRFGEVFDKNNENRETFSEVFRLIQENNDYDYFYIVDMEKDELIIKIPEFEQIQLLEYKNNEDVRNLINSIKT